MSTSSSNASFDPGPSLRLPSRGSELRNVWCYIFKEHRIQIGILVLAAVTLLLCVFLVDGLRPEFIFHSPSTVVAMSSATSPGAAHASQAATQPRVPELGRMDQFLNWMKKMQFILGIFTTLIAAFVWYGEIHEDWELALPSVMSVFFFFGDKPVIVCRNTWLAGADDLRNWGQQVGSQAVTGPEDKAPQRLDFGPDIHTPAPVIAERPDGKLCRHYVVRFSLTKLPHMIKESEGSICRYQNLLAADEKKDSVKVHSVDVSLVDKLREVAALRPSQ